MGKNLVPGLVKLLGEFENFKLISLFRDDNQYFMIIFENSFIAWIMKIDQTRSSTWNFQLKIVQINRKKQGKASVQRTFYIFT